MKNAIEWMKSNPLTVASLVVALLALLAVAWGVSQAGAFRTEVQDRVDTESAQIERHLNQSVQIPPESPDAPSETLRGVITEGAISELERLYGRINEEYQGVRDAVVAFNSRHHERLVPDLFTEDAGANVPYDARDAYRQAFGRLFQPLEDEDKPSEAELNDPMFVPASPRLDAGMPPSQELLERQISQLEEQIRATYRPQGVQETELTSQEQQQLREEKAQNYRNLLMEQAQRIHIYADSDPESEDYPFQIGAWSRSGESPASQQLWEGQLELWIQQDIVRALAKANRVWDDSVGVDDAPVKRLLSVEVVPGYVGLHTLGGVRGEIDDAKLENGGYSAPVDGKRTAELSGAVPVNFHVGPTGRVSNAMYDVRHVRLRVIADDRQLPKLFEAFGDANFMTVLKCTVTDVDEYAALEQGFVYGTGNAVEAELIVETVWLREWTQPLMPDPVRQYVGIDDPEDTPEASPDAGGGGSEFGGW